MTDSVADLALVGSGEFLPVMAAVDARLLAGRAPVVAVVPTAAAQDGEDRVRYWFDLAHTHYASLGASVIEIPVLERADAFDPEMAARLSHAGLIYLSGGNPGYLGEVMRDTPVWKAIVAAVASGAAIAGCSAGAMAMTALAPDVKAAPRRYGAGLALIDHLAVIPHFDRIRGWLPEIVDAYLDHAPPGATVVGIDEATAVVRTAHGWQVSGRGAVTVFTADRSGVRHHDGASISFPERDNERLKTS